MGQAIIEKSVDGKFPIGLKYYSPDLETGETISACTVSAPAGITVVTPATINGNEVTSVVSSGVAEKEYRVQFKVTTSSGKIFNHPTRDSILVKIVY